MTEIPPLPNLQETDRLLSDLFQEVRGKEAFMAGGSAVSQSALEKDNLQPSLPFRLGQ